jgi:hypothetical protein
VIVVADDDHRLASRTESLPELPEDWLSPVERLAQGAMAELERVAQEHQTVDA